MLTTEQCIEIAEKVWGWKCESIPPKENNGRSVKLSTPLGSTCMKISELDKYIEDEVNSWQGFGRTVDRIASEDGYDDCGERMSDLFISFLSGHILIKTLWERTHLAALEAINDNQ